MLVSGSASELEPDRGVIGGPLLAAWAFVDLACGDAVHRLRREQQMVDPQPLVAVPAASLVIPEGVAVGLAVKGAVGIGEAEMEQRPEARARLDPAQRIVAAGDRVLDILVGLADVVIAGQNN